MRNNDVSPQYFLFQTIKTSIARLHEVIHGINEHHEQLEKKMENRTKRITGYIAENEINRKEIMRDIKDIKEKIECVEAKLNYVDRYIKEQELKLSAFGKIANIMKQVPSWIIFAGTVIGGIVAYYLKIMTP